MELYLTEALQLFNGRCDLATSVLLGVAAEQPFLVMTRGYAASATVGGPAMAKEFAKPRSNYFALWTGFRKRIEPGRQDRSDRGVLPESLPCIFWCRIGSTRPASSHAQA